MNVIQKRFYMKLLQERIGIDLVSLQISYYNFFFISMVSVSNDSMQLCSLIFIILPLDQTNDRLSFKKFIRA